MADILQSSWAGANSSSGASHLSVTEGNHPAEIPFLFEQQRQRMGPAVIASAIYHVVIIALIAYVIRYGEAQTTTAAAVLPEKPNQNIVWLKEEGPGGGGGGGGNKMKEPPRKAEIHGKDKITVPVVVSPVVKPPTTKIPDEIKVEPNVTLPNQAQIPS